MKTYIIKVTENISHSYEIEAESEEAALEIYDSFNDHDLKTKDLDGSVGWDSPWEVEEQS
jgi:hypothetical protein